MYNIINSNVMCLNKLSQVSWLINNPGKKQGRYTMRNLCTRSDNINTTDISYEDLDVSFSSILLTILKRASCQI